MGNFFIVSRIALFLLGVVVNIFQKFNFPHLSGDILIQKENFVFYFPILISLIISLILTIIFNLFK
ncbi:MAG: DUF2905 domain-containing protein [Patescibacteria group bacterium]|nr:DUF2905 domain-containing protein [Patescibacteria group bacterium]